MPASFRLALGAVCIAFAPILAKGATLGPTGLGPTVVGFYRCLFGAVILLTLALRSRGQRVATRPLSSRARWALCLLAGGIFALDLAVWHRSVVWAGAGLGTILGNTQVFYLGLIGLIWQRERLSARYLISVPLAFVGIVVLVGSEPADSVGDHYRWGVAFGLATGIVYASFLMVMRRLEAAITGSTMRLLGTVILVAAGVLAVVTTIENGWGVPTAYELGQLLLLAAIPQALGWWLITRSLPDVPVSTSGLILLLQPALATLLGSVLFDEPLGVERWVGAFLTFVAIYLGSTRQATPASDSES